MSHTREQVTPCQSNFIFNGTPREQSENHFLLLLPSLVQELSLVPRLSPSSLFSLSLTSVNGAVDAGC